VPDRFQPRLESLRGVAALMVAYFHALAMIRMDEWWPAKIKSVLQMAGNGNGGVAIFFVLSGYVLGRSLDATSGRLLPENFRFMVRRTLRIWPAMAVCIVACFAWVRFVHAPASFDAASTDYYNYWRDGAPLADLWRDLLLQQSFYNPVTWTLQVEMIAAVVFVALWWIWRRSALASLALTVVWAAWFLAVNPPPRTAFLYMLLLGLQAGVVSRVAAQHLSGTALKWCLALSFAGLGLSARYPRATDAGTWFVDSLFSFAIVALLIASHGRVALKAFDHSASRFMGRISYSFYLWHFPVLYVLVTSGFAAIDPNLLLHWPNTMAGVLMMVSVTATIPIAWASYRFVELPMIRLAKRMTTSPVRSRT